jgi:hypothetical protein
MAAFDRHTPKGRAAILAGALVVALTAPAGAGGAPRHDGGAQGALQAEPSNPAADRPSRPACGSPGPAI